MALKSLFGKVRPYAVAGLWVLLIVATALFSGFLRDVSFGQIVVVVYAVIALIFKIPSATTFKMTLISLVIIPLTTTIDPEGDLANTFAVYAYLLLVAGLMCAVREFLRSRKQRSSPKKSSKKYKKTGKLPKSRIK